MPQLDAIWDRARSDLAITTPQHCEDPFLWEHAARIARCAREIAKLPSVTELAPDGLALEAAALYHDAAWTVHIRDESAATREVLVRPPAHDHRELSASLMERSLGDLLPSDALGRASRAIRSLDQRDIEGIEGQILADAENLDEFGVVSLWTTIRRGALDGKAIQGVIDRWHRRKEYHFWSARLNDSFHFQAVRAVAKKRLATLERLMHELEEEQAGRILETD